jgi:hypothetical protein
MFIECKKAASASPPFPSPSTWVAAEDATWVLDDLTLLRRAGGWCVERGGTVLLAAASLALHPTTVCPEEWYASDGRSCPVSFRHVRLETSCSRPVDMSVLGLDFFTRMRYTPCLVWFRAPNGEVHFSRSKGDPPGKRYCNICDRTFSSNNFASQHMKAHHTLAAFSDCLL